MTVFWLLNWINTYRHFVQKSTKSFEYIFYVSFFFFKIYYITYELKKYRNNQLEIFEKFFDGLNQLQTWQSWLRQSNEPVLRMFRSKNMSYATNTLQHIIFTIKYTEKTSEYFTSKTLRIHDRRADEKTYLNKSIVILHGIKKMHTEEEDESSFRNWSEDFDRSIDDDMKKDYHGDGCITSENTWSEEGKKSWVWRKERRRSRWDRQTYWKARINERTSFCELFRIWLCKFFNQKTIENKKQSKERQKQTHWHIGIDMNNFTENWWLELQSEEYIVLDSILTIIVIVTWFRDVALDLRISSSFPKIN